MKIATWTDGPIDSRYGVFAERMDRALLCHVFSGHHEEIDIEILKACESWTNQSNSEHDPRSLIEILSKLVHDQKNGNSYTTFSCVAILNRNGRIEVRSIGEYFCAFLNGRAVSGGRSKTSDWKTNAFDVANLSSTKDLATPRMTTFFLDSGDEAVIGPPFLEYYASPSEIAHMSATDGNVAERVSALGKILVERERSVRRGTRYDYPRLSNDRLLICLSNR